MAVDARCPNPECRKSYSLSETLIGRAFWCEECGKQFTVVDPARDTPPSDATTESRAKTGKRPPEKLKLKQLGRFEVREAIGSGGYGAVFRAYDPQLDREIALKVPRSVVLENPKARERFLREAKAASQLRHPNIVPVHEAGREGKYYYIASAFIEGRTLAQTLKEREIGFEESARIIMALAQALAYAHDEGVIHRDVKPSNVMLDANDEPHLMDFGIAHREDVEESLTIDGTVLGTPAYMSPEQAQGKKDEISPATDQYSLGVMLFELMCKQKPFSGPSHTIIYNKVHRLPPTPHELSPAVPRDLETICLKAMARDREGRYSSCWDLADDLRRWLSGQPVMARPLKPVERFTRWCRREPKLAASAGLVVALLVAVAAVSTYSAAKLSASSSREAALRQDAERSAAEARELARRAEEEARKAGEAREEAEAALTEKQRFELQANRERKERQQATSEAENAIRDKERAEADAQEAGARAALAQAQARADVFRYDEAAGVLRKAQSLGSLEFRKKCRLLIQEYTRRSERLETLSGQEVDLIAIFSRRSKTGYRDLEALLRLYLQSLAQVSEMLKARQFVRAGQTLGLLLEKPSHAPLRPFLRDLKRELEMLERFLSDVRASLAARAGETATFRGIPVTIVAAEADELILAIHGGRKFLPWTDAQGRDLLSLRGLTEESARQDDLLGAGMLCLCDGDGPGARELFSKVKLTHRNTFYYELSHVSLEAEAIQLVNRLSLALKADSLADVQTLVRQLKQGYEGSLVAAANAELISDSEKTAGRLIEERRATATEVARGVADDLEDEYQASMDKLRTRARQRLEYFESKRARYRALLEDKDLRKEEGLSRSDVTKSLASIPRGIEAMKREYENRSRSLERDHKRRKAAVAARLQATREKITEGQDFSREEIRTRLAGD